jgi:prepilin-type N-terminal cleavage/methylation domain-containing protein
MRTRRHVRQSGFTLLEVILSMGILALLSASVYAIVSSSIGASRAAMEEQLAIRRLDAFLRVMRDTFLNLPAQGTVAFEAGKARGGEPEPRLLLGQVQGIFGMPSLAGGTAVLAARPRADGTRTITLLRIPAHATEREQEAALAATGIPLLPKIRQPRWSFFQGGAWREEWPPGSPRPSLVRFEGELEGLPDPVDAVFYIPPLTAPAQQQPVAGSPSPSPSPAR